MHDLPSNPRQIFKGNLAPHKPALPRAGAEPLFIDVDDDVDDDVDVDVDMVFWGYAQVLLGYVQVLLGYAGFIA